MIKKVDINDNNFLKTKIYHLPFTTTYLLPLTSYLFFKRKAQVMLEFAFCMIILFLMMYGIIMVFRWVGLDLGQRRKAHEAVLEAPIDLAYGTCVQVDGGCLVWDGGIPPQCTTYNETCVDYRAIERGPLSQIDPYFYTPSAMNAVWTGD